jgi:hypothetical protein
MTTNRTEKGETARRIYAALHRNPGLTSAEIAERLPDLTPVAVQCALHKMKKRGAVEVRGRKVVRETVTSGSKSAPTYHVKYKSGAITPPKPKPKPKKAAAPKVKVPKVKVLGTVEAPKVDAELVRVLSAGKSKKSEPKTDELVLQHLADIYKSMHFMAEQHDKLIQILDDTLAQLRETEEALAEEMERRNWWDRVKGWFG